MVSLKECAQLVTSIVAVLLYSIPLFSQDSSFTRNIQLQDKYLKTVNEKAESFNKNVNKYTENALNSILNQEKKMQQKVARTDSAASKKLFGYAIDTLKKFQALIQNKTAKASKFLSGNYFPYMDTLKQSIAFLNKADSAFKKFTTLESRLAASLNSVNELESKLGSVQKIEEYLKQRQAVLENELRQFPALGNNIQNIKKQAYYYKAQVEEYKSSLQNPEKIEKLALSNLQKLPVYQEFIERNSQLAGIFASAFTLNNPTMDTTKTLAGLTSRASVQQTIQNKIGSSSGSSPGPNVNQLMQQQIGAAQAQLGKFTDKLNQMGGMGSSAMPDFTPNNQKTKPFKKRLEFGVNMQFVKNSTLLPTTGNFALQAGYKINDKSTAGIGVSYIMGLGSGWNDISFTSQGLGLRSYFNWKLKKGFSLQGGSEWNYMSQFRSIRQLQQFNAWQTSALIGLSRAYKVGKKLTGNMQVLYDLLHGQHIPNTQPILFRIGYNL